MEFIAIFGLIVSTILLCQITFYFYLAYSSKNWKKVNAIVEEIGIKRIGIEPLRYQVFIQYSYFEKDKKYFSKSIGYFPNQVFKEKLKAEKFLESFAPKKNTIEIYVYPLIPKFSLVLAGVHNKNTFVILMLMSIIGLIFFWYLLQYAPR